MPRRTLDLSCDRVSRLTTDSLSMWLSGNRSSLKIDLITEDPKIRKLYCIEKSITNNRNTGNKSLYNCIKKIYILFNSSKHENIFTEGMQTLGTQNNVELASRRS